MHPGPSPSFTEHPPHLLAQWGTTRSAVDHTLWHKKTKAAGGVCEMRTLPSRRLRARHTPMCIGACHHSTDSADSGHRPRVCGTPHGVACPASPIAPATLATYRSRRSRPLEPYGAPVSTCVASALMPPAPHRPLRSKLSAAMSMWTARVSHMRAPPSSCNSCKHHCTTCHPPHIPLSNHIPHVPA